MTSKILRQDREKQIIKKMQENRNPRGSTIPKKQNNNKQNHISENKQQIKRRSQTRKSCSTRHEYKSTFKLDIYQRSRGLY